MTETEKPAPDGLEVSAYAEVLAGRVTAVRIDKSRHCVHSMVLADQAQSLIAKLRGERDEALADIERINAKALDEVSDLTIRAETAEAEVKRLTEENEGLTQNAESLLEIISVHKARINALEESLRPLAAEAEELAKGVPDNAVYSLADYPDLGITDFTVGHLRSARAFLKGSSNSREKEE